MPRPMAASNAFYRRICGQSTSCHWVCMASFIGIFLQSMVSFKAKDCKADTLRPTKRLANQKKRKKFNLSIRQSKRQVASVQKQLVT